MQSTFDKAFNYAKQIAYSSETVLKFTYEMAVKYRDSPGVYCECGCAAGAQIIMMAAGAPHKTIYAFDSFEGIPLASNKDDQAPGIAFFTKAEQQALPDPGKQVLKSSGATVVPVEHFFQHVANAFEYKQIKWDKYDTGKDVRAIPGWFEETVPKFVEETPDLQIAILRLDGDLYNSTYVCLKHLYPKVIDGGCVIIDDIQLPGCRQAVKDYFEEEGITEILRYVDNIAYFLKGPTKEFAI